MSALCTVFFEFCQIVCYVRGECIFFFSCIGLFVTLVPCALSSLTSVWLFVTLLLCALFFFKSARFFVTSVFAFDFCLIICYGSALRSVFFKFCCSLFSLSSVRLFVTLGPCALVFLALLDCLLR